MHFNGTLTVGLITKVSYLLVCYVTVGLMFNWMSKQLVSVLLAKCLCLCTSENPHCAAEHAGYRGFPGTLPTTDLCCCDWSGLTASFVKVNLHLFEFFSISCFSAPAKP